MKHFFASKGSTMSSMPSTSIRPCSLDWMCRRSQRKAGLVYDSTSCGQIGTETMSMFPWSVFCSTLLTSKCATEKGYLNLPISLMQIEERLHKWIWSDHPSISTYARNGPHLESRTPRPVSKRRVASHRFLIATDQGKLATIRGKIFSYFIILISVYLNSLTPNRMTCHSLLKP